MKNKFVFISVIFLSLVIFFLQTYSTIKYRSQIEDDRQATVLVQKSSYSPPQSFQRLLKKDKIILNFTAKYNNLGTIALYFDNHQKINTDWVWFRIRQSNSEEWYYQNKYNSDQFNPDYYFTFGFPTIVDSKNKEYQIEIESISGTPTDSISLHSKTNQFIAKYSYPKSLLVQNPKLIPSFLINKIKIYLSYLSKVDKISIATKSALPIFLYLLIIYNPLHLLKKYQLLKKLESNSKLNTFFDIFTPIFIFLATFIISGYFSTIGADPHHDGILFKPALDVSRGSVLFRDTFTQYGALTTYIQAFAIKIFGPYLITIKLLTVFFYSLISLLLYFIFIKFLPKTILFVSLIIWLLMAPYYSMTFLPWSSVYAMFFQLLACYLFILYFEKNKFRYFILASISTALIFWIRQPVGVFSFLAVCAYFGYLLITKQIKYKLFDKFLSHFLLINFFVFISFLLYFISNHTLLDWWKQSILLAFVWAKDTSNSFNILKIINSFFYPSKSPISVWTLIPVSTLILWISNHKNKKLLILILIGLASWTQYYPVTCIRHMYWAATPMIPLFSLFVYQFIRKFLFSDIKLPEKLAKLFSIVIIIICFLPDISYRLKEAKIKINTPYQYIEEPSVLKNIKLPIEDAQFYQYMSQEISQYYIDNPQGNLVTNGINALYLTFDPRITNIQQMYVYWPTSNTIYPNYRNTLNEYFETNKPLLISFWNQVPPGYCRIDNIKNIDSALLAKPCQ